MQKQKKISVYKFHRALLIKDMMNAWKTLKWGALGGLHVKSMKICTYLLLYTQLITGQNYCQFLGSDDCWGWW